MGGNSTSGYAKVLRYVSGYGNEEERMYSENIGNLINKTIINWTWRIEMKQ